MRFYAAQREFIRIAAVYHGATVEPNLSDQGLSVAGDLIIGGATASTCFT
jgi:hypothetical protein